MWHQFPLLFFCLSFFFFTLINHLWALVCFHALLFVFFHKFVFCAPFFHTKNKFSLIAFLFVVNLAYDLATQCESRRASLRRHTIVGCQSFKSINESHSVPPSRPQSRQSEHTQMSSPAPPVQHTIASSSATATNNSNGSVKTTTMTPQQQQQQYSSNLNSINGTWGKNSLDEQEWREKLTSDRLSLTLEEIVHIRSVITKAELESLPMGIQIKEDVEKRKLCFLCLRTKFGILGPRGVPCKLCQRTVCAKCYTKMRIPTEHFSNVPVQLLSPSRQNSPSMSNVPSPSHHHHGAAVAMDESFPRSLMERLLRTDVDRKVKFKTLNFVNIN